MSEPIISVRGLTKKFGDFTAVDDLAIDVERGAIFAFLGANGSGKSITIRMLIGLLQPTAGAITVDGVDVIAHPRRVRDRIGYMGQKVSLYQGLTLRENVEFYAGLYGLAGAELSQRWGDVRERFSLGDAEHERPEDLPAALRQRAGLALATLHGPQLLFLDEPTAGVDVHSRELFWERIQEQADAGVTVFVTTHFLEEVDYCSHVCFIADGRLVANATPEALRAAHSDGYRIALDLAPSAAALAELRAAGFELVGPAGSAVLSPAGSALLGAAGAAGEAPAVATSGAGFVLRCAALDDAALVALARALGPTASGRVRVEQPQMNEIFRRLMRESQASREAAA